MNEQTSNRRIAQNTVMLYLRMIVLLLVSLYTSRVVLDVIGVDDYGLYNVVGGIVTVFAFLSSAMGNSTQRFITYSLGEGNVADLKKVFSTTCLIHWLLALLIFVLAETIGLWFLNHKMIIPVERMGVARWVYQFSVVSCILSVVSIPYYSLVIAHEKMGTFAMLSIVYALAKLIVVFIVSYSSIDSLYLYALLLLVVQVSDRLLYLFYCKKLFPESRKISFKDVTQFNEIAKFAGWSLLPNLATVSYTQGVNILLNVFFGPAVNAARGLAVQVQGMITNFVTNFQTAVSPQIIKSYAVGDRDRLFTLIFSSSKFSFYLLLCLALPVVLEADFLLSLWLKIVPEHTASFFRLIIFTILMDPLANPLCVANNATGDVRTFKIVESSIYLLIIPLGFSLFKFGGSPESIFCVQVALSVIVQYARVTMLRKQICFSYFDYWKFVLSPVTLVALISPIVPLIVFFLLPINIWSLLLVCIVCVISVCITAYYLGLNANERLLVNTKILSFTRRMIKV